MRPILRGNLAAALSVVAWTTAFPATELLLRDWHPLPLAAARISTGALVLLALLALRGGLAELRLMRPREVLLAGAVGFGLAPGLLVGGQALSNQVSTSIITTATPLVAALIAWRLGEEPMDRRRVVALVLAIGGGILAALGSARGELGFRGGEVLVLVSVTAWVCGSRLATTRLGEAGAVARSAACLTAGGACLSAAALVGIASGLVPPRIGTTSADAGLLLWIGVMAVGASAVCWLSATRLIGVTLATMHQNLVPFYVMLAALAMGGTIRPLQAIGAVLVVAGAVLAQVPADSLRRTLRVR